MCLAGGIAVTDQDTLQAVIANDTAPERIVEIKNQAATTFAAPRRDYAADVIRINGYVVLRERQFCHIPQRGIVPVGQSDICREASRVKNSKINGCKRVQLKIYPRD